MGPRRCDATCFAMLAAPFQNAIARRCPQKRRKVDEAQVRSAADSSNSSRGERHFTVARMCCVTFPCAPVVSQMAGNRLKPVEVTYARYFSNFCFSLCDADDSPTWAAWRTSRSCMIEMVDTSIALVMLLPGKLDTSMSGLSTGPW